MKNADLADSLLASVQAIGLTGWKRDGETFTTSGHGFIKRWHEKNE